MLFKPEIMAHFPVETMQTIAPYGRAKAALPLFHFKGSISQFCRIGSEAVGQIRTSYHPGNHGSAKSWYGMLPHESLTGFLQACKSESALKAFLAAEAKLNTPFMRDRPQLSVIGSSFSMGRVMQGHPVQCFRRPKKKLPPKRLELACSVSSFIEADAISAHLAKVSKAAQTYHLAGGAMELVIHYSVKFTKPNPETKAQGLAISLIVPLGDGNQTALAGSVQFFRAICLPFAKALSGYPDDGLPTLTLNIPGVKNLSGNLQDAEQQIAALNVE